MAKRKSGEEKEEVVAAQVVVKEPEPADEPEAELPYTVGAWHGHAQFACKLCPWDTLEGEAAYWEHWRAQHAPPAPPKPLVQAYDAGGRPIEVGGEGGQIPPLQILTGR